MDDLKTYPVLVTGITGFVGSHVAIQLLEAGYKVRGSLRSMSRADSIRSIIGQHTSNINNLEFVEAELLDKTSWEKAVQGCRYVHHIASPVPKSSPKDENELIIPAREGALNVLRASMDNGVKRVILTSSIASMSYGNMSSPVQTFTEEDWTNVNDKKDTTPYIRSKTIAEKAAWDFIESNKGKLELTVVNPSFILGPVLEKDYGSSAELIRKLLAGDFPGAPQLDFSLVDVCDVARLHILAMEKEVAAGQRFIANSENRWMSEIADILKKNFPDYTKKLPRFMLPNLVFRIICVFDPVARYVLNKLNKQRLHDNSKAKSMLGWQPRSPEEGIIATAESLIRFGIV